MAKSNPKNNTTRFTQTVLFFGLTPPSGALRFSSPFSKVARIPRPSSQKGSRILPCRFLRCSIKKFTWQSRKLKNGDSRYTLTILVRLIILENKVYKVQLASSFLISEFVRGVLSGIKQKTGLAGRRKSLEMAGGRFWLRSVIIESFKAPEGGR